MYNSANFPQQPEFNFFKVDQAATEIPLQTINSQRFGTM